jgi:hypothetical protein
MIQMLVGSWLGELYDEASSAKQRFLYIEFFFFPKNKFFFSIKRALLAAG